MCVWSAYAGTSPAAPELWESLGRIEGIWAGFYTGIVTADQGKLYWKKCAGHTGVWAEQYRLDELKGCTGLIHSRTNSGGDGRRAHPYIGASARVALVSQGCTGIYSSYCALVQQFGNEMLERGRVCRTAGQDAPRAVLLKDGNRVSMSDVVVNMAEEEYLKSHDPLKAMRSICGILPEESATVFLFADRPGYIGFVNANQHLVCDFEPNGVYLSVSAIGVPGYAMELPGNTLGFVTAEGKIYREPLSALYAILDPSIPAGAQDAFERALREEPGKYLGNYCDTAIRPLFKSGALDYHVALAWRCLENLYFNGHIRFEPELMPGAGGAPGRMWKIFYRD